MAHHKDKNTPFLSSIEEKGETSLPQMVKSNNKFNIRNHPLHNYKKREGELDSKKIDMSRHLHPDLDTEKDIFSLSSSGQRHPSKQNPIHDHHKKHHHGGHRGHPGKLTHHSVKPKSHHKTKAEKEKRSKLNLEEKNTWQYNLTSSGILAAFLIGLASIMIPLVIFIIIKNSYGSLQDFWTFVTGNGPQYV